VMVYIYIQLVTCYLIRGTLISGAGLLWIDLSIREKIRLS
jgi:hypothetical protein